MATRYGIRSGSGVAFGEIALDGVWGNHGVGMYPLVFSFHLSVAPSGVAGVLADLTLDVRVTTSGGQHRLLGRAEAISLARLPIAATDQPRSETLEFRLDLDGARLRGLESLRAGGDLGVGLNLWARVDGRAQEIQMQEG